MSAQWSRSALIKENPQGQAGVSKLDSAYFSTASAWARCTPGNHSRKSSTVAPSSKFSNKARTGTLVPRKIHAPLTR